MWVKTCKACVWRSNHAPLSHHTKVWRPKNHTYKIFMLWVWVVVLSYLCMTDQSYPWVTILIIPVGKALIMLESQHFVPPAMWGFITLVCPYQHPCVSNGRWSFLSLSPFPTSHFPSNRPTHIHDHVLPFQTPLPSPHSHTQSVIVTTGGNHSVAFWPPPHPHLGADSSCLPRCANSWVRGHISPLTSSRWCRQNRQ